MVREQYFPWVVRYPIEIVCQRFQNAITFRISPIQISGHYEEAGFTRFAEDTRVVHHVRIQGTKADGAIIRMHFPHMNSG